MNNVIEIHIEQLGPIRNSKIELKPFMVFSGESGMGKSYTALLVHYIYRLLCEFDLNSFFEGKQNIYNNLAEQSLKNEEYAFFHFTLKEFEMWCSRSAVSYLADMLGIPALQAKINIHFNGLAEHYEYTLKKETLRISDKENEYYESVFLNKKFGVRFPHNLADWATLPLVVPFRQYLKEAYFITQSKTFLLPPSRGALVGLSDVARSSILASVGMYREFLADFSALKVLKSGEQAHIDRYSSLSSEMLRGNILVKDNDLFYVQQTCQMPVTAAASSVKELAPFALMLQKGVVDDYSILFEEPESHLHPEMQIKVADLLAIVSKFGGRIQITSHSDYLLRRINDLIRLDILKDKLPEKDYKAFCKKHHYDPQITLSSSKVGALYFEQNQHGTVNVISQNVKTGIPFDTFRDVLNNQLSDSSALYDKLDEIG